MTPPQDRTQGVAAITFELNLGKVQANTVLSLRVQDCLDPRREIASFDFTPKGDGYYQITLDHPDMVFLPDEKGYKFKPHLDGGIAPPPVLLLSLESNKKVLVKQAAISIRRIDRKLALKEAGEWRKFIVRGLFHTRSEPRPWCLLNNRKPIREQIKTSAGLKRYKAELTEILENVEIARQLLPDDKLVNIFYDWIYQSVDRNKTLPKPVFAATSEAPQWARLIRHTWLELEYMVNWWFDNRLVDNGELGGGLGDDTDLLQAWQSIPFVESAPMGIRFGKVAAKLSEVVWKHNLEEGININTQDGLHGYEEGANLLSFCAQWFYGDPYHYERVMISARSVLKLLVKTNDGRWHFGSNYVGIKTMRHGYPKLGKSPGDGNWAPVRYYFHPVYVAAMYNQLPALVKRFSDWGQTWADYQKPGHFVGKVDIKTGKPIIVTPKPSQCGVGPVREWIALYQITDDPKWLKPLKLLMDHGYWGTAAEYGRCLHPLLEWESPYQEKMKKFKSLKNGYPAFFVHKDRKFLEYWLKFAASWTTYFRYIQTKGEQKTDRVLTYNATVPLSCYLGDAPNRNRFLDFKAVSYEGLRGRDFAGLVWDAGRNRLKLAMFNFTNTPQTGLIRVWRLENGKYDVRIGIDDNDDGEINQEVSKTNMTLHRYSPINFTIPPRKIIIIEAKQTKKLDNLRARTDVAVSPFEMKFTPGQPLNIKVHNIGAKEAKNVKVVLKRGGKVVAEKIISNLPAPLDLKPKIVIVTFKDVQANDEVILDPENQIDEITKHNNRVLVR